MSATVRYLTHTNVLIVPDRPAGEWGLNPQGQQRAHAIGQANWITTTNHIFSSGERKAIETATPIAATLGIGFDIRDQTHENDRSSTGYLPPDEFEETADRFFADPNQSVRGWETATHAQTRIVRETEALLGDCPAGDVLIIGHGAVGTLLLCHLAGFPIERKHDQPPNNGGNYFSFCRDSRRLLHLWKPAAAY